MHVMRGVRDWRWEPAARGWRVRGIDGASRQRRSTPPLDCLNVVEKARRAERRGSYYEEQKEYGIIVQHCLVAVVRRGQTASTQQLRRRQGRRWRPSLIRAAAPAE